MEAIKCVSVCLYRKYEEALEYHQQARILDPQNPSTYSAIGYVYALRGDHLEAVDYFHKVNIYDVFDAESYFLQ